MPLVPPPPLFGGQQDSSIGGLVPQASRAAADPEAEDVRARLLGSRLGMTLTERSAPTAWQEQPKNWAQRTPGQLSTFAPVLPAPEVAQIQQGSYAETGDEWAQWPGDVAERAGEQAALTPPPTVPSYGPLTKAGPAAAAVGGASNTGVVVLFVAAMGAALYFAAR